MLPTATLAAGWLASATTPENAVNAMSATATVGSLPLVRFGLPSKAVIGPLPTKGLLIVDNVRGVVYLTKTMRTLPYASAQ
jgi:hypothetical protein